MELPYRPRRLRRRETLRRLVRETHLRPDDFIYPLFVAPGNKIKEPINAMPGVHRWSVDLVTQEIKAAWDVGVPGGFALRSAGAQRRPGQRSRQTLRRRTAGHRTIKRERAGDRRHHRRLPVRVHFPRALRRARRREVDNDATLELLARMALSHAEAGADIVAPSDMMDGRVRAIRQALDEQGFPSRQSCPMQQSTPPPFTALSVRLRSRRPSLETAAPTRWIPPIDGRRCVRCALDIEEGADIVMVKPACPYLDVHQPRQGTDSTHPLAAYQVSGEYSMVKAAAAQGWWIDKTGSCRRSLLEHQAGRSGSDHHLFCQRSCPATR